MNKYNIKEKKIKRPDYQTQHSPEYVERIFDMVIQKVVMEKKYRDPEYNAAKLAKDVGVNSRCLAAVINIRYRDNFSQMVNDFRIREVQYMLSDPHFKEMSMEEISAAVGYTTRQSFHLAFYKRMGVTPRAYRSKYKNLTETSSRTKE
jgi:AraC-like DNA-binding protein